MKHLIITALIVLGIATSAFPYSVVMSHNGEPFPPAGSADPYVYPFDRHWGEYWAWWNSSTNQTESPEIGGNTFHMVDPFEIISDTSNQVESVSVALTFTFRTYMHESDFSINPENYQSEDGWVAKMDYSINTGNLESDFSVYNYDPWTTMNDEQLVTIYTTLETYSPYSPAMYCHPYFEVSDVYTSDPSIDTRRSYWITGEMFLSDIQIVPEPASLPLLSFAFVFLFFATRKNKA